MSEGRVAIVGAGPGPADLLTVRAARTLREAQVVLYDDLVSPEVLGMCPESARSINVGKRYGKSGSSQEQINALMIWHAQRGRMVVRLKSGDPAVFGRLGEELDALREAGIPFEIVPGITAAAAAASAAELTLTDRRAASTLVIMTAHQASENSGRRSSLDPEHSTFAVYMPGPDYARTAKQLMTMGIDSDTSCAVVSRAGRRDQSVRFLTLAGLANVQGIVAPALLVVGKVAERRQAEDPVRILENTYETTSLNAESPAS